MIEMARRLGNRSRLEVRAVIQFLSAKNVSASAMSRQHVAKFVTVSRVFSLTCPLGSLGPELMATLFQPKPRSET
ncbi:hypothetical protein TNCV_4554961 [Trichonephila clavipes]|nr:hypothetical protein TNCV_4554961 [Trichonephila clavipes]